MRSAVCNRFLRMRYLMSSDAQYAWAVVRAAVEKYVHAAWMPPMVRVVYEKVRMWMEGMGDTQTDGGCRWWRWRWNHVAVHYHVRWPAGFVCEVTQMARRLAG